MIRFVARYNLAVDDIEVVDAFADRLMGSLLLDGDVAEPDFAVSMTEGTLEVFLLVDTEDPLEAVDRGHRALRVAFTAAGHPGPPNSRVFMHRDLIGPEAAVRTELVGA